MYSFRLSSGVSGSYGIVLLLGSLLLSGMSLPAAAQNDHIASPQAVLPSSDAIALIRQVGVPVGNYTGVPNISIPVYALSGKDISVPLSLRYHSALAHEVPATSWVGNHWVLEGAGLITRVINGISDFETNGCIGSSLPENLSSASSSYINEAINGTSDTGPDIFYFNFAGYKGKFAFTPQGQLITDPSNHLKIEPINDENGEWAIYDAKGYQYIFGGTNGLEHTSNDGVNKQAVTSWYLTKIISPLKEEVVFLYKEAAPVENTYYNSASLHDTFTTGGFSSINVKSTQPRFHFVPRLKEIVLDNGISGQRLIFESSDGGIFNTFSLLRRIIIQVRKDDIWKQTGYVNLKDTGSDLSQVKHYASEQTEYERDEPIGVGTPEMLTNVKSKPLSTTDILYTTLDGTKLISEIKYNSGRKVKYFFEPHDFSNITLSTAELQKVKPGYRIEHIAVEGAEPLETYFHYENNGTSSGTLHTTTPQAFTYTVDRWVSQNGVFNKTNGSVTRNTIVPFLSRIFGEPTVTYTHVGTESPGKGKVEYQYTAPGTPAATVATEGYYAPSFTTPSLMLDFEGGKLRASKVYKFENNQWQVVSQTIRHFEPIALPALKGLNLVIADAAGDKNVVNAAAAISGNNTSGLSVGFRDVTGMQTYERPVTSSRLTQAEDIYSENGTLSKTTVSNYEYNSHNFLSKSTTLLADGVEHFTTHKYPFDFIQEPVYSEMVNRGMLAYPIETMAYKRENTDEFITGGSISHFGFFMDADAANNTPDQVNEHILAQETYIWENPETGEPPQSEIAALSSENYKLVSEFDYDADGNLVETRGREKVSSLIYDHKKEQVIAQVANAPASEAYFNGFESNGSEAQAKTGLKSHASGQFTVPFTPVAGKEYVLSYWYYSNGAWYYKEKPFEAEINEGEALDEVRVCPTGARMTTSSYDWKGNLVSTTDANNRSVYYDYNDRNQVIHVRNNEKDIVQTTEHNYSYIGSCEEENVQPISGYFQNGDNISLSLGEIFEVTAVGSGGCGKLYYNWYYVQSGNSETYLGTTDKGKVELAAPCKEFFTVKCEIVDEYGTGLYTIRKHARVNMDEYNLSVQLYGVKDYYCRANYDQIAVAAYAGGCFSPYTYKWTYTYHNENTSGTETITATGKEFVEKYLGPGTLKCVVTDSKGNSYSITENIAQDKICQN